MTPEQEERRGEEAAALLRNPLYNEAWNTIRDKLVEQLESADLPADRRTRLNDLLVAHKKARQYMERLVSYGTAAAQDIERQRTMRERVQDSLRRW